MEDELQILRLQNARLQALRDYPGADVELLNDLTDPEQIAKHAQRSHQRDQQSRQQQRVGGSPSPNPPAGSDPADTERETQLRRWSTQARHNQLRNQLDLTDATMARDEFFARSWNQHMADRKNGTSSLGPRK